MDDLEEPGLSHSRLVYPSESPHVVCAAKKKSQCTVETSRKGDANDRQLRLVSAALFIVGTLCVS